MADINVVIIIDTDTGVVQSIKAFSDPDRASKLYDILMPTLQGSKYAVSEMIVGVDE